MDDASASGYVRLVSAEKHVFVCERRVALVSGFVRTMLASAAFREGKGEIELPDITTAVLEHTIACVDGERVTAARARARISAPDLVASSRQRALNASHQSAPHTPPIPACRYWMHKVKYHGSKQAVPEFAIPAELALPVLVAADFLEC